MKLNLDREWFEKQPYSKEEEIGAGSKMEPLGSYHPVDRIANREIIEQSYEIWGENEPDESVEDWYHAAFLAGARAGYDLASSAMERSFLPGGE